MSHRAIVAVPSGSDTFNVHYSQNGAYELQLREQLSKEAERLSKPASQKFGNRFTSSNVPRLDSMNTTSGGSSTAVMADDSDAIESDPIASNVPLDKVGAVIEFDDIEAFYLVREGNVETYVPVWMYPNAIRPILQNLTLEVYRGGRLPKDPDKLFEKFEAQDPIRTISDHHLSADWLSDSVTPKILRENNAAITSMWRRAYNKKRAPSEDVEVGGDDVDMKGFLDIERYVIIIGIRNSGVSPPPSRGLGLFVGMPESAPHQEREEVWRVGSNSRFQIGAGLNAMRREPDKSDITEAMSDIFLELFDEYGDRISEDSPPPAGHIVKLLRSLNVDSMDNLGDQTDEDITADRIRDLFSPGRDSLKEN